MELKLIHVLGPVIATVAMLFYGRVVVGRANGRQVRITPTLILIAGAILFRQFTGDGTFLDRICLTLLDFGIAMIIDSAYLAAHKEHPKMFWVPGVLALVVSFIIYFLASLFGWTVNSMFAGDPPQFKSAEVLVELGPDDDISELEDLLEKYDASYEKVFPNMTVKDDMDLAQFYAIDVADGKIEEFIAEAGLDKENIDGAEANGKVALPKPQTAADIPSGTSQYLSSDPGISQQWWLKPEEVNQAHAFLSTHKPKKKAIVAILDTGVDAGHEDLKSVFGKSPGNSDLHGHGTHCAGLAGANTDNGLGMASYNWKGQFIEVRGYAALNKNGQGDHVSIARTIQAAAEDGADVISMSLGMYARKAPAVIQKAANYAFSKGCILVAAAGNDYGDDAASHSPANVEGMITVSAIGPDGNPAEFSNTNGSLKMPIAAPGHSIYSTLPNGTYQEMSGTSMATPIVAGCLGILRAFRPDISKEAAWILLKNSGIDAPFSGKYGRVIQFHKTLEVFGQLFE